MNNVRTVVARDGKVLVATYKNDAQKKLAAWVITKRREALVYLASK